MLKNRMEISQIVSIQAKVVGFSGVILLKEENGIILQEACGLAERSNPK